LLPGFGLVFQCGHADEKNPARLEYTCNFVGNPFDGGIIPVIDDLNGD
jgi:hypothetical protein